MFRDDEYRPPFGVDYNADEEVLSNLAKGTNEREKIVEELEFEENGAFKSAVGVFVPNAGSGAVRSRHSVLPSAGNGDQAICRAKKILNFIAQHKLICMSENLVSGAMFYYKSLLSDGLTHARLTIYVCAALLYVVCRMNHTNHLLVDFSEAIKTDVFVLGRTYTYVLNKIGVILPLIDPCLLVERYGFKLNFGAETRDVCNTAVRLVGRMKRDWIHLGRRPNGICGAALLVAAQLHGKKLSINQMVRAVRISKAVLLKRLCDVQNTPTSALTLEDFFTPKLEKLVEQDPPSFQQGRKNYLRRNEIEMKNQWLSPNIIDQVMKTHQQMEVIMGIRDVIQLGICEADKTGKILNNPKSTEKQDPDTSDPKNDDQPPSTPPKPTLTLVMPEEPEVIENDDPEIDDNEIDEYILSKEEVEIKTKVWEEDNKDFLRKKQEKQKEREFAERFKKKRAKRAPRTQPREVIPKRILDNLIQTGKNALERLNSGVPSNAPSQVDATGKLLLDNEDDDDFERESTFVIDMMIDSRLRKKVLNDPTYMPEKYKRKSDKKPDPATEAQPVPPVTVAETVIETPDIFTQLFSQPKHNAEIPTENNIIHEDVEFCNTFDEFNHDTNPETHKLVVNEAESIPVEDPVNTHISQCAVEQSQCDDEMDGFYTYQFDD